MTQGKNEIALHLLKTSLGWLLSNWAPANGWYLIPGGYTHHTNKRQSCSTCYIVLPYSVNSTLRFRYFIKWGSFSTITLMTFIFYGTVSRSVLFFIIIYYIHVCVYVYVCVYMYVCIYMVGVCMCACVCTYVYAMCTYVHACAHTYVHMYVYVCVCSCMCVRVCVYVCCYVYMYVYMCVYVCRYVYACMYVCICIYVHVSYIIMYSAKSTLCGRALYKSVIILLLLLLLLLLSPSNVEGRSCHCLDWQKSARPLLPGGYLEEVQ